jgi:hypothetical protein
MIKFPEKKQTAPPKSTPAFTIDVDKSLMMSSRRECTSRVVALVREITEKYNIILPAEYMLAPELIGKPDDPGLTIGFHLIMKINPWREWLYFMLLKVPFFGRFVRGPVIVSHLMPSLREVERLEKTNVKTPISH